MPRYAKFWLSPVLLADARGLSLRVAAAARPRLTPALQSSAGRPFEFD